MKTEPQEEYFTIQPGEYYGWCIAWQNSGTVGNYATEQEARAAAISLNGIEQERPNGKRRIHLTQIQQLPVYYAGTTKPDRIMLEHLAGGDIIHQGRLERLKFMAALHNAEIVLHEKGDAKC